MVEKNRVTWKKVTFSLRLRARPSPWVETGAFPGQIPLVVFYSMRVLPMRLAIVSTQGLCRVEAERWRSVSALAPSILLACTIACTIRSLYCPAVFGHFSPAPVKTDRAVRICTDLWLKRLTMKVYAWLIDLVHRRKNCPTGDDFRVGPKSNRTPRDNSELIKIICKKHDEYCMRRTFAWSVFRPTRGSAADEAFTVLPPEREKKKKNKASEYKWVRFKQYANGFRLKTVCGRDYLRWAFRKVAADLLEKRVAKTLAHCIVLQWKT